MRQKLAIFACILFVSCGIDEYFYLPQVPEANIIRTFNNEAVIEIPQIPSQYYYAGNYVIFYRIYVSNTITSSYITPQLMPDISNALSQDYIYLETLSDPTNTTSITSAGSFSSRNYFEIEFEEGIDILSRNGGTLRILFPTQPGSLPVAYFNDGEELNLMRSSRLISPEPRDSYYFLNTSELRDYDNANSNTNADVSGRTGEMHYAYVSMYIVAVGTNPLNFTSVYSKPTHISVFKLPDAY